ncbi:MAG: YCF48-related protein [Gemmataceae bacterium]
MKPIGPFVSTIGFAVLMTATFAYPANAQSWHKQTIAVQGDFRGLSVVSSDVVWVSGTKGSVARTADGGKQWHTVTVPHAEKLDFRDVEAFGDSTAYLLSSGPGEASRIYKTTDAGKNWTLQFQSAIAESFFDSLAFWDERNGIALSDPVKGKFHLITTSDGGANWKPLPDASLPEALPKEGAFAASGTCLVTFGESDVWFATGGAKSSRVFHSADRGKNWQVSETPVVAGIESAGIFSLAFRDAKHGMIVGGDYRKPNQSGSTAAITTDGGRTWTVVKDALPFCSAVAWAREQNRWIAVGTSGSFSSADDGKTWKRIDRENLNAVQFRSPGQGWTAGPKSYVAKFASE